MILLFHRLGRLFREQLTILVIPHTDFPLLRGRFSFSFLACLFGFWTLITVWAGYLAGRQFDYWVTKGDNWVIRAKMEYLAKEVSRSRNLLEEARKTDDQMRTLLGLKSKKSLIEHGEGMGGPTASDRSDLNGWLAQEAARVSQPAIRGEMTSIRQEARGRLASFQEIAWFIAHHRDLYHSTPNVWPAEGRITSSFGYRFSPVASQYHDEQGRFHEGIDIANAHDTPIYATADGHVRYAGWSGGYGEMVLVSHAFGYSTLYSHASKVAVRKGDWVRRGQMIGYMGTTGHSTGSHLHYEVWHHRKPVNPLKFLTVRPDRQGLASASPRPGARGAAPETEETPEPSEPEKDGTF